MSIDPTAIIEDGAVLGADCVVHAYAVITRHAILGDAVVVHPFAVIGGDPQDLGFDPKTRSFARVGARTVLREHVTINRATKPEGYTEVGADAFLMASSHVAHDCQLADRVILANAVLLAGHVSVGERAFIGGGAAFHQFCRIGETAMVGGGARITRDIPPFTMATERDELTGLNRVGIRRRGFPTSTMAELKRALASVCAPVGNARDLARQALATGGFESPEALRFLAFFDSGKRGFLRLSARIGDADTSDAG